MIDFTGRDIELGQLQALIKKKTASLVVVFGRRRIGKSTLIEHFGQQYRCLSFEGLAPHHATTMQDQLDEFSQQLVRECGVPYQKFSDWSEAFLALSQHTTQGRQVILLDEVSWMAMEDPNFAGKLKIAWDKYFKKNRELILIVCGSVSAWIQDNIVMSTGFYGRISLKLYLRELPLTACKAFWGAQGETISAFEKLKVIAVTGGIPRYLEEIDPSLSAEDNIRRLAFSDSGILFNDYNNIFTDTLLRRSDRYNQVVRLLSDGAIESVELARRLQWTSGSYLTEILDELVLAGFISQHSSWNLKTGALSRVRQYRLSDNYIRFYLKYVEPNIEKIMAGQFANRSLSSLPGWAGVMGLQIENLVLNNRDLIKGLLQVSPEDVVCDNPYLQRATQRYPGCQIDYLVHTRHDNLYVCEIKYTRSIIRKCVIDEVKEKIKRLRIPRHVSIRPVLIYLGDVHDEVLDADYFSHMIDIASLL